MNSNIDSTDQLQVNRKVKGISGSTLKLVAIFTMLIDHSAATILEGILRQGNFDNDLLYQIYGIMRYIGRLAFPIFCFLLVEGIVHTHNKWKYAMRLAIFALISEIPFDLAFSGKLMDMQNQNVYFTLLIGLMVMIGFVTINEKWSDKLWLPILAIIGVALTGYITIYIVQYGTYFFNDLMNSFGMNFTLKMYEGEHLVLAGISAVILFIVYIFLCREKTMQTASIMFADLAVLIMGMLLANKLKTDYGAFGVLTIAIMYILRRNYMNSMLGGCMTLTIMSIGEFTAFFDMILMEFYNGKRGLNLKYIFYGFYPVHLLLLYFICYGMNLV